MAPRDDNTTSESDNKSTVEKFYDIYGELNAFDHDTNSRFINICNGNLQAFSDAINPDSTASQQEKNDAFKNLVNICQDFIDDLPLETPDQIEKAESAYSVMFELAATGAAAIEGSVEDSNITLPNSLESVIKTPQLPTQLIFEKFSKLKSFLDDEKSSPEKRFLTYQSFISHNGIRYQSYVDFNLRITSFPTPSLSDKNMSFISEINEVIEHCYCSETSIDRLIKVCTPFFASNNASDKLNQHLASDAVKAFVDKNKQTNQKRLMTEFETKLQGINTLDRKTIFNFKNTCKTKINAFKKVVNNPASTQAAKDEAFKELNSACSTFLNTLEGDKAKIVRAHYVVACIVAAAAFLVGAVLVGAAAVSLLSGGTLAIPSFAAAAALSSKAIAFASAMSVSSGLAAGGLTFGLFHCLKKPDINKIDLGITKVGEIIEAAENAVKATC